ncbi:uncharacterized protein [Lepeophtheirus salmonis]|uniref:uncharacterized protein n=1 Tax=Lepeophtheirus salmonis TaxID=72036 RepID=UPI001AEAA130|nr:estrogen receptor-like [Lepeophtheirus salmonis]
MEMIKESGDQFKSRMEEDKRLYLDSNSKEEDPMRNQICRVCDEPAAGYHFGAFTCEGCKSFFGRTCGKSNLNSISECKNNYSCVIDKKNRTSCKACRLRKCLRVGMSKAGSRYGRRSNWFKMHCVMSNSPSKMPRNEMMVKTSREEEKNRNQEELLANISSQFPWWYFVLQRQFLTTYENSLKKIKDEDRPMDLSRRS